MLLVTILLANLTQAKHDCCRIDRLAVISVEQRIPHALQRYKLDVGSYPTEDEGGLAMLLDEPSNAELAEKWAGPYVKPDQLKDPWGNKYRYTYPGRYNESNFDVSSDGPDKQEGTDDDITNWERAL